MNTISTHHAEPVLQSAKPGKRICGSIDLGIAPEPIEFDLLRLNPEFAQALA
jgi:hypothetical protein